MLILDARKAKALERMKIHNKKFREVKMLLSKICWKIKLRKLPVYSLELESPPKYDFIAPSVRLLREIFAFIFYPKTRESFTKLFDCKNNILSTRPSRKMLRDYYSSKPYTKIWKMMCEADIKKYDEFAWNSISELSVVLEMEGVCRVRKGEQLC